MKKKVSFLVIFIFSGLLFANGNGENEGIFNTNKNILGKPVSIIITEGSGWWNTFKYKSITINSTPQIVVWAETLDGKYLNTLFVTEKFGKQNWRMTPEQKKNETFRVETVPYWMYKLMDSGINTPTENNPMPDDITGATPDKGFTINSVVDTELSEITLLLEVNHSFDGNEDFPDNEPPESGQYNAASGQPSLVYKANVKLDEPGIYLMEPVGYSSPSGVDGSLTEDLSVITTALQIIAKVEIKVD